MSEFIDFKRMYIDTLVDCDFDGVERTLFFKGLTLCGSFYLVSPIHNDISNSDVSDCLWCKKIRISAKNPWLPWFGGDCPVPPNCNVEVYFRIEGVGDTPSQASEIRWSHNEGRYSSDFDVIAYRLAESPWQTINGVCNDE